MGKKAATSLEGALWRGLARFGATHGPEWFIRASPPLIGVFIGAAAPGPRRQVRANLRRVRGERGALRDGVDVARTFASYASCLAETLGADSRNRITPKAVVWGEPFIDDALADGRGVLLATAHTAGWETVGPLLSRDRELRVMIAVQAERDPIARHIQDAARAAHGVVVSHVGGDPLSALPLAAHLRRGGAVAVQIDRVPGSTRARGVTMFGSPCSVPEGPLRLAMLTGAPIVPVFAARTGHRRYEVRLHEPIRVARNAGDVELDAAAQRLADALQGFVRSRPTQWFHFAD